MSIGTSVKNGISDFVRGLKIIVKGTGEQDTVGDKNLARLSRLVMVQVDTFGVRVVRPQVITGIENDLRRVAKKGPEAVEALVQNALRTPDYMKMLRILGMEEPHIRVMAMQALKSVAQKESK